MDMLVRACPWVEIVFSNLVWLSRVPSSGRVVLLVSFAARGRRCLFGLSCCFAPCVHGCALLFREWYSVCDLCALTFLRFSGSVCVKTIVFKTERLLETLFGEVGKQVAATMDYFLITF